MKVAAKKNHIVQKIGRVSTDKIDGASTIRAEVSSKIGQSNSFGHDCILPIRLSAQQRQLSISFKGLINAVTGKVVLA
jgi:hypothetical protein